MKEVDKNICIERYTDRFLKNGYSPESLGWGKQNKESIRFQILREIGIGPQDSVLDVGCGFGDFRKYLLSKNWNGKYVGVDIVEALLTEARQQQPDIEVYNLDIQEKNTELDKFDFVVSSGVFNFKLEGEDNYEFIESLIKSMFEIAEKGVAVDFLSSYVDFQGASTFHSDPGKIIQICKSISKRIKVRLDYMPYEFAVYIYKEDAILNDKHVFSNFKIS